MCNYFENVSIEEIACGFSLDETDTEEELEKTIDQKILKKNNLLFSIQITDCKSYFAKSKSYKNLTLDFCTPPPEDVC